ncbi:ABC transporter permease [Pseudonocardia zijingensis]|uniref:ABC transporter permease subunit n=1 Tax=Pseudonocardia zijingensis TaxID=153376 RepID=A0ABN1NL15_9PSEU
MLLLAAAVGVWWLVALLVQSSVLPDPATAVTRLVHNLGSSRFLGSLAGTLARLAVAYLAVVVIGGAVGFALGLSRFWTDAISPLVYTLYSIPKVVLFPLFLVFLGLGGASQIGFAIFSGILPMILMMAHAAAGVPRLPLKLAASLRMGRVAVLRTIAVPSVLPAFTSALRLTFGLTFLSLLIVEMFSGVSGLGYELLRTIPLARMGDIVGMTILVVAVALAPVSVLRVIEQRVNRRFGESKEIS